MTGMPPAVWISLLVVIANPIFGMSAEDCIQPSVARFLNRPLVRNVENELDTFQDYMHFFRAGPFPMNESHFAYESESFDVIRFDEFEKIANKACAREFLYKEIVAIENNFKLKHVSKNLSSNAAIDIATSPVPYALIYLFRQSYKNDRNGRKFMLQDLDNLSERFGWTLANLLWQSASTGSDSKIVRRIKRSSWPKTRALEWYLSQIDDREMGNGRSGIHDAK